MKHSKYAIPAIHFYLSIGILWFKPQDEWEGPKAIAVFLLIVLGIVIAGVMAAKDGAK